MDTSNNTGVDVNELRTFFGHLKKVAAVRVNEHRAAAAAAAARAGVLRYCASITTAALMAEVEAQHAEQTMDENAR